MLMFFYGYKIFEKQNSDRITKRMVPVGNGYDHENASVSTTTVSSVITTENIAQTSTNKIGRGLPVVYRTTTKRSRRKNNQSTTPRCKF